MGERLIKFCNGCMVEQEDPETVRSSWGKWLEPPGPDGRSRELDLCPLCKRGAPEALIKLARNNQRAAQQPQLSQDEEENEPLSIPHSAGLRPESPRLTKSERERFVATRPSSEASKSR
jgi:hypothetical protein